MRRNSLSPAEPHAGRRNRISDEFDADGLKGGPHTFERSTPRVRDTLDGFETLYCSMWDIGQEHQRPTLSSPLALRRKRSSKYAIDLLRPSRNCVLGSQPSFSRASEMSGWR